MENITVDQISTIIVFLATLVTSFGILFNNLKKWLKKVFKEELQPINEKLDKLSQADRDLELNSDKNFLVRFLREAEEGHFDEVEQERFYETYKRYHQLGGNSYIDHKVEKLKKEGKL